MTRHPLRGLRIVIIGGSLAGLFAANMLHRAGAEISLHERTPGELSARGAGLSTHAELFECLARAGVTVGPDIGVSIPGRIMLAHDGTVIARHDYPQVMTGWGRLHHLLQSALPAGLYHGCKELLRVEQESGKTRAVFLDGQTREADLIVGADGPRSTIRAQYAPQVVPRYAGYVAWRGMGEERALSPGSHASVFGWLTHFLPPSELAITYPVAGAADSIAPGHRRTNLVWYRPADSARALRRMMTDESGVHYEHGIPPQLVCRAVIAGMVEDAERLLPPQMAEVVRRLDQPFFQPIIELESPAIVYGRVALVGDAAFVARPHPGMGVTKAAGDARCLTDALIASGGAIDRALADYVAKRDRFGRMVVRHGQKLGLVMGAPDESSTHDPYVALSRDPDILLRDMGKPPPWS